MNRYTVLAFYMCTSAAVGTSAANAGITDGLVAYYPFDGDASDYAPSANNGSIFGDISFVSDVPSPIQGQALSINSAGSYVSLLSPLPISGTDYTLALWIKTTDSGAYVLHSRGTPPPSEAAESLILIISSNALHTFQSGYNTMSFGGVADGQWHHVAITRDDLDSFEGFLDGVPVAWGTSIRPETIPYASQIGGSVDNYNSGAWFVGLLDELRVYNRNLSNDEIAILAGLIPERYQYEWIYNPTTGNVYRLTSPGITWSQAESEAVAAGGHLVTINSQEEQSWLQQTFSSQTRYWIGFADAGHEGLWSWLSGDGGYWQANDPDSTSYVNWCPFEPNGNGTENIAVMNWGCQPNEDAYRWNDWSGTQHERGIIEKPGPQSGSVRVTNLLSTFNGVFPSGVNVINTITATVDWAGSVPQDVVLDLNGHVRRVATGGSTVQTTYNMGTDLTYGPGGKRNTLTVYALDANGGLSPPVTMDFYGLELPQWAVSLETNEDIGFRADASTLKLTFYGDVVIPLDPLDPEGMLHGSLTIPNGLPEVGGMWGIDLEPVTFGWELSAQPRFGDGGGLTGTFNLNGAWGASMMAGSDREGGISAALAGAGQFYPEFKLTDVSANLAGSFTFLFPRVPLLCQWTGCCHTGYCPYFQASIKPEVTGVVGMEEGEPSLVAGLKFKNATLDIGVTLAGTVGAGSEGSLYYVAGTIGGRPYIVLQFPGDPINSCLNDNIQEVGFNVEASFVVEFAGLWMRQEEWIFDLYTCPDTGRQFLVAQPTLLGGVEPTQREYLDAPEGYCVFPDSTNAGNQRAIPGLPAPILNVGTGPLPSVAATSNQGLLTFVYDDATKPTGEHQEIYFARWDGGTWTAHAPLTNNNQPDIQPAAAIDSNGTEIAVWVRGPQPTGSETGPRDVLPGFDIAYSSFDTNSGSWSTPAALTSNGYADILPWFDDSGPLRACWVASATNDNPVWYDEEIDPSIDVFAVNWNGASFDSPYVVAAGLAAVSPPALVRSATDEFLAYLIDVDTNSGTAEDREVMARSRPLGGAWSADVALTVDLDADSAVQMALDSNGSPVVTWVKRMVPVPVPNEEDTYVDQLWFATWDGAAWSAAMLAFESKGIKELKLIRNDAGKLVLFWVAASEEFSDLYYSVYDTELGMWGFPQQITHDVGAETMLSLALSGGNVLVGFVKRRVDLATSNGVPEIGFSDICLLEHTPSRDLVVTSNGFSLDPTPVLPGLPNNVCINVRVVGDFTVDDVAVDFYEGAVGTNGALIGSDTIARLLPGESQQACFAWNVPTNGLRRQLFAVVDPTDTIPEIDELTNNVASVGVLEPDLRVSAPAVTGYPGADTILIGCSIRNDGTALAGGSKLEVRETDAGGPLVFSMNVPDVANGTAALVQFTWDVSSTSNGVHELYFDTDVDDSVAEANELNNVATIGVPVLGDLRAEQWSGVYDMGTAGVVIRNAGAKPMAESLIRATVDTQTVGEASVPALNPGQSALVSIAIAQAVPAGWLTLTVNPHSDGNDEVTLLNNSATAVVHASGDWDGDGDIDLGDLVGFVECVGGPDVMPSPTPPATSNECLAAFDFEADSDVDFGDFRSIQRLLP